MECQGCILESKKIVERNGGATGVLESVIEGIQTDPVGPTNRYSHPSSSVPNSEIYTLSDTVEPITPDSRRTLIAIRINDPTGKLAGVLDRAMKNEPDAKQEDYMNYRLWKVTRVDDEQEGVDLEGDFGSFNNKAKPKENAPADTPAPLLSNWAITIYDDYLIFASMLI